MSGWREMVDDALRGEQEGEAAGQAAPPTSSPLTEGLASLQSMQMPAIASPDRWGQVLADAAALILDWGDVLHRVGWTVGDVFGLDLGARQGDLGLAYDIRGGRVVMIEEGSAMIRDPDGVAADGTSARLYYRTHFRVPDPPKPVWLSGGRK